jgi:hypothetical protein
MSESQKVQVAPDVALPLETVTETIAVLGIRGSGKTNTATVIAEELLRHGQQVVVLDPTDCWWGLRSSSSGKQQGFPVVVMGGRRGDLPLAEGDGDTLADFVVDHRASVVLSLRHFESRGSIKRFVTAFARRLYYRKGKEEAATPLMVMIDEASIVVPQRVMGDDAAMVGAIQQLVRQGRSSGIGVTLVDQRPATVNKDVLAQLELLICHRITSPQDRKALVAWVEQHDTEGREQKFLAALASLARGTAWMWSPGWLNLFREVRVRPRSTFDSSRTPRPGEVVAAPKVSTAVDLAALKEKLGKTLERARADDPAILRKRIAELEREAKKPPPAQVVAKKVVDQAAFEDACAQGSAWFRKMLQDIARALNVPAPYLPKPVIGVDRAVAGGERHAAVLRSTGKALAVQTRPVRRAFENGEGLTGPEQRILDAIAWQEAIGITEPDQVAVAFLAGYRYGGGAFNNPRGRLASRDLVRYPGNGRIALTDAGRRLARPPADAPSIHTLHQRVLSRLPGPERRILSTLLDVYPKGLSNAELAQRAGYSPGGGAYNNPRGRLRTLGLVTYSAGDVIASPVLFPEALG